MSYDTLDKQGNVVNICVCSCMFLTTTMYYIKKVDLQTQPSALVIFRILDHTMLEDIYVNTKETKFKSNHDVRMHVVQH